MKSYRLKTKGGQVFEPQFKDLTEMVTKFHDIYCMELGLDKEDFISIEEIAQQDVNRRHEVTDFSNKVSQAKKAFKEYYDKEDFEEQCRERYGDNLP